MRAPSDLRREGRGMRELEALAWLAVLVIGAFVTEVIRAWLGTEVRHQDHARGVIYYIATFMITILVWEAGRLLMRFDWILKVAE